MIKTGRELAQDYDIAMPAIHVISQCCNGKLIQRREEVKKCKNGIMNNPD